MDSSSVLHFADGSFKKKSYYICIELSNNIITNDDYYRWAKQKGKSAKNRFDKVVNNDNNM